MTKNYLIILCFLLPTGLFAQQNLVPNSSFEDYNTCPNALDQLYHCQDWYVYRESPDYFHTCSSNSGMMPPETVLGYQWPLDGDAFIGLMTFSKVNNNGREFAGAELLSPLEIDEKYYVSFNVSLAGGVNPYYLYNFASNNIGVRFFNTSFSLTDPAPIDNFAHFYTTDLITDTAEWVHLSGSFIADSAYTHFAIGNFFDDNNTDTMQLAQYAIRAYYFIDNIYIAKDSLPVFVNKESKKTNDNDILIFPNPTDSFLNLKSINYQMNSFSIIDLFGEEIIYEQVKDTHARTDLSSLKSGIYLLKIQTNEKIIIKKIKKI